MSFSCNGSGLNDKAVVGCVGEVKSSGIAPPGAGSSVIGRSGSPVRRSRT